MVDSAANFDITQDPGSTLAISRLPVFLVSFGAAWAEAVQQMVHACMS